MPLEDTSPESVWEVFLAKLTAFLNQRLGGSADHWVKRLQEDDEERWFHHHKAVNERFAIQALPAVFLMKEGRILHRFPYPPKADEVRRVLGNVHTP